MVNDTPAASDDRSNGTWRDVASPQAQADLDELLSAALGAAMEHLEKNGEFYPFAMSVDGEPTIDSAGEPTAASNQAVAPDVDIVFSRSEAPTAPEGSVSIEQEGYSSPPSIVSPRRGAWMRSGQTFMCSSICQGCPSPGGCDHLSTGVRRCSDASSSGPRIPDPGRVRAWQRRRAPPACQTGAARHPGLAAGMPTSTGFYAP